MRSNYFFLILILICIGCSDNQDEFYLYKYFQNSTIELPETNNSNTASIIDGNKLVFEYTYELEGDPEIPDSQFKEIIIFEIDPSLEEFSYTNQELVDINTYYRQLCFCPTDDSILITTGSISGRKLSETTWDIDILIDIDFPSGLPFLGKEVSGVFRLSN